MFNEEEHPRDNDGKFTDKEGIKKSGYDSRDDLGNLKKAVDNHKQKDRKANADEDNKTSIREQVKAGVEKLENTKVLAVINKEEVTTDFKKAITELQAKLSQNGGVVKREGFGDVQVGSRLKQAGAYLKTAAEIAAVETVPSIIEKGVLIDEHNSHKGRGYPTFTFAGKVSIDGQKGIVAVVVKKTTGNFYKVHRVLTPNGQNLEIENDTD